MRSATAARPHPRQTIQAGARWVGPVAAAALLMALIGFGVVTSATNGVPKLAAPAHHHRGIHLPPTTPPPTTDDRRPADRAVLRSRSAATSSRCSRRVRRIPTHGRLRADNYQLWATDGASATTVRGSRSRASGPAPDSLYTVDAYRVQAR